MAAHNPSYPYGENTSPTLLQGCRMPISPPNRLLLVSSSSQTEECVRHALERAHMSAELAVCSRREELRTVVEKERPALLLVGETGLPGQSAERIVQGFAQDPSRAFLVLEETPGDSSRLHLLHKWGSEYIPRSELHLLPVAIEHALREREARMSEQRLQVEMHRAADAVGQSYKLASIGRLAGSIAHEINNPLESITNLLYLISNEPGLPVHAKTYLEMAQSELDRVVEISKQTLTFSRESSSPVPVHMPALLEEVLTLYRRRLTEKHIKVGRDFRDGAHLLVYPGELRQVFSNLIANAIEAMEPGGTLRIRVRPSTRRRGDEVQGLRISIADTGVGMDAETVHRLGEPFFTTKGHRGTGLGLWVTRSIVRRYHGSLHLRSRTGALHGTVFSIFIPADAQRGTHRDTSNEINFAEPRARGRSGGIIEEPTSEQREHGSVLPWRAIG